MTHAERTREVEAMAGRLARRLAELKAWTKKERTS